MLPARTLCIAMKEIGHSVHYVGRNDDLERNILAKFTDTFYTIPTGKFRRNLNLKTIFLNLIDIVKVLSGIFSAIGILAKIKKTTSTTSKNTETLDKPNLIILSTGGYVSLPVVIAGWLLGLSIAVYEQTAAGGLANRIAAYFAKRVFISVPSSKKFYSKRKVVLIGYPIRAGLRQVKVKKPSNKKKDLPDRLQKIITKKQPVLLFSGGGNGSLLINHIVKKHLNTLTKKYSVIHQTGKNFIGEYIHLQSKNYYPFDFISGSEWDDIFIRADVLIGRSGAGIVHECIYLNKRAIFIPLAISQQNEQLLNAKYAQAQIPAIILNETQIKKLSDNELLTHLKSLLKNKPQKRNTKTITDSTNSATEKIITRLIELTVT